MLCDADDDGLQSTLDNMLSFALYLDWPAVAVSPELWVRYPELLPSEPAHTRCTPTALQS